MTVFGIIFIDLVGIGFLLWILNLVRTKKLYITYAAIWVLAMLAAMALISIPPILNVLPALVGARFPASALSLLAFAFIFAILIFFSVQLSYLTKRQTELIQALAIKGLLDQEDQANQPINKSANEQIS